MRIDPRESPMRASKWLSCQLLIDADEMAELMKNLGDFYIYLTSSLIEQGKEQISKEEFLDSYRKYVSHLMEGKIPEEMPYRHIFSSIWTASSDMVYAVPAGENKFLIRVSKPVIQLQAHRMNLSPEDGKFRSMTFGPDSISWGLQFSYPQIYQEGATQNIYNVTVSDEFPNTQLFQKLQRWVRHNTSPTPIIVGEEQVNLSMRLGKNCFSWINKHPQLIMKGLRILSRRKSDEN